jgi:hypothetical protein
VEGEPQKEPKEERAEEFHALGYTPRRAYPASSGMGAFR